MTSFDKTVLLNTIEFQKAKIAELRLEVSKQNDYIKLLEEALMGDSHGGLREVMERLDGLQVGVRHFPCPSGEQ